MLSLLLLINLLSTPSQAAIPNLSSQACMDVFARVLLAEGEMGNKVYEIQDRGQVVRIEKQYATPSLMKNDVLALQLIGEVIKSQPETLANVRAVEVLQVVDSKTLQLEYARGGVIENLIERIHMDSMSPSQRASLNLLREISGRDPVSEKPRLAEQEIMDRPLLIRNLNTRFENLVRNFEAALRMYVEKNNGEIVKIESQYDSRFPSVYAEVRLPGNPQVIEIYIKPDNIVLTRQGDFLIFDPF